MCARYCIQYIAEKGDEHRRDFELLSMSMKSHVEKFHELESEDLIIPTVLLQLYFPSSVCSLTLRFNCAVGAYQLSQPWRFIR